MHESTNSHGGTSRTTKIRLFVAFFFAIVGSLINLYGVLGGYENAKSGLFEFWGILNVVPAFTSILFGGHAGNNTVFVLASFLQWFGIGWLVGLIVKPT